MNVDMCVHWSWFRNDKWLCVTAFGAFPLNVFKMATSRHSHTLTWRECHIGIASSFGLLLGGFSCMSLFSHPLSLVRSLLILFTLFSRWLSLLKWSLESFNLHAIIHFDRYQRMNLIPFTVCHPSIANRSFCVCHFLVDGKRERKWEWEKMNRKHHLCM